MRDRRMNIELACECADRCGGNAQCFRWVATYSATHLAGLSEPELIKCMKSQGYEKLEVRKALQYLQKYKIPVLVTTFVARSGVCAAPGRECHQAPSDGAPYTIHAMGLHIPSMHMSVH